MRSGVVGPLRIIVIAAPVVTTAALMCLVTFPLFGPTVRHLMLGWWDCLVELAHRLQFSPLLLGAGIVCAVFSLLWAHSLLKSNATGDPLRKGVAPLCLVGATCLLLACAGVGYKMVGDVMWLAGNKTWREVSALREEPEPGPFDHTAAARRLVLMLRLYASDCSGSYPQTIGELVRNSTLNPDEFYRLFWREFSPGHIQMWLYDNVISDSSHGDLPLLISPPLANGIRVVAFNDSRVETLNAELFRYWVEKWKGVFKEMREPMPEFLSAL